MPLSISRCPSSGFPSFPWDIYPEQKEGLDAYSRKLSTLSTGGVVALLAVILARLKVAQRQSETRRVSELVQIALDTLRNQEMAHHTDPVTAPQPYLSSIQLRDLILQNEHSIPTRRRLWDQVEHVVEGNANVRANLEEIEGGDELRVWRWVGSTGLYSP